MVNIHNILSRFGRCQDDCDLESEDKPELGPGKYSRILGYSGLSHVRSVGLRSVR
jgi:hypothetical protein